MQKEGPGDCLSCHFLEYRWVVTAAHCVSGKSANKLDLVLGNHDVTKEDSGEKRIPACKIKNHPRYSRARVAFR